ncbi:MULTISPECIES: hypothetical protein [unclassified Rossellomorea]|uniref:hypothetical protein n=1 Tax=unclassified Rossellomorea TaxID=2837526 RepID=UPI00261E315B|nr:hypothetical protein [uncultured Rossellomorea sp.]
MEQTQQFLQLLRQIRKKLWINQLCYYIQLLLVCAGVFVLGIVLMAALVVIPYWERILWVGCHSIFIGVAILFYRRRATLKDSALTYDVFVEDNRVSSAYSSLHSGHALSSLVVHDALNKMKRAHPEVLKYRKKRIKPSFLITSGTLMLLSLLIFTQWNTSFQEANRIEKEKEIIAESNKRIEEKAKKKENASIKEKLLKKNEELGKVKEAAKRYDEITKKVKELEFHKKSIEKQNEKLQEVKKRIADIHLENVNKALQEKNSDKLQRAFNQLTKAQRDQLLMALKSKDIASLEELSEIMKESDGIEEQLDQFAKLQDELQNEAGLLKNAIGKGNTTGSEPLAQNSGKAPSNQANSKSQGKKDPSSSANGNQPGTSATNSHGQGGNGNGAGNGNGSSPLAGNGAGNGQGSREMLSVPEKIKGHNHIERDTGKLGEGQQGERFESNGPVQKGTLRPYEEVYQDYYSFYRKSSDRSTIPKDLENIVQSYFSEIDPGELAE